MIFTGPSFQALLYRAVKVIFPQMRVQDLQPRPVLPVHFLSEYQEWLFRCNLTVTQVAHKVCCEHFHFSAKVRPIQRQYQGINLISKPWRRKSYLYRIEAKSSQGKSENDVNTARQQSKRVLENLKYPILCYNLNHKESAIKLPEAHNLQIRLLLVRCTRSKMLLEATSLRLGKRA